MIDSHAHVYVENYDEDRDAVIERARKQGIRKILLPNIDLDSIAPMLATEQAYPDICHAMMGLHPCHVDNKVSEVLDQMEAYWSHRDFIAVGEIGLDFYHDTTFKMEQIGAFERQLQWAIEHNKPVVIHARKAMNETFASLKKFQDGNLKGVFHCFCGSLEEAQRIQELGFHVGIGGVATFKNSGLGKIISQIDMAQIILETDCPYLTPTPYRGQRNEPAYTYHVAEYVAQAHQLSIEQVVRITDDNVRTIFGDF